MRKLISKFQKSLQNPILAINVLSWEIRSYFYRKYIDEGSGRIIIRGSVKVLIRKDKNSRFNLYGDLVIEEFKNSGPVIIAIGENAQLNILGDFIIGDGVKLSIANNALLSFGGKRYESASGITGNSMIMANKKIEIGYDFLCAWDVFISDSDWHSIVGQHHQKDISIGNHVWIANNNNILKGTRIGNNCIVSSCSKVANKSFSDNVLIGGVPAKVLKENVEWCRDL